MLPAQRPITLEQFLRLPERKPSLEFEDGEVKKKEHFAALRLR